MTSEVEDRDLWERARGVARTLMADGHEAWFAGGCVRDRLLGRRVADVDVATSARPERVQQLFRRTIGVGKQFGVIVVLSGPRAFDVATFRTDGAYADGRRPESVTFSTAEEDVRRRDFTINGLLMHPLDGHVTDHVGGLADLEARVIRTIGAADDRFDEDHLRILRALRFAARLDFRIEAATAEAIARRAAHAADPSPERVLAELGKIFGEDGPGRGLRLLDELGVLDAVLPEVAAKRDVTPPDRLQPADRTLPHALARAQALLDALNDRPHAVEIAWAVALEDGTGGSLGDDARRAGDVLKRLRAANALIQRTRMLVGHRDRALFATDVSRARRSLCAAADDRELLRDYVMLELSAARPPRGAALAESVAARGEGGEVEAAALPQPLLRGPDLVRLGVPSGPALGRTLRRVRFLQLQGRLADAAEAEAWVRSRVAR